MFKRSLILLSICFIILQACEGEGDTIGPDGRTEIEIRAFELINNHRNSKGLPLLEHLPIIFEEAKIHSDRMARRLVPLGHDEFSERVNSLKSQISIVKIGENVAFNGSNTPAVTVVDQWLASQGHKDNIEEQEFTHTGLAAIRDDNGVYYFTQIFIQMP